MAELICPNCNSRVKLPEHSSIGFGVTLSKESKGTHYLNMETEYGTKVSEEIRKETTTMTKNEQRLATLKANGIDISKYFNVKLPTGGEMIMEIKNGVPTPATLPDEPVNAKADVDVDDIRNQIIEDGYVKNSKLHRRFVMAQVFRMMGDVNCSRWSFDNYTNSLNRININYALTMTLEELRVQTKLFGKDEQTFRDRNSFFNKTVAVAVATAYAKGIDRYIDGLKTRNCKGVPYKTICGKDVFVEDITKKVTSTYWRAVTRLVNCDDNNPFDVYRKYSDFCKAVRKFKVYYGTDVPSIWKDAYKGAGAYYTIRNMVMFHDCELANYETGEVLNGMNAVKYLERCIPEYEGEGWRFLAMLRKCINDNDFRFGR